MAGCAERCVLAIDLGTSGAKVAVATSHGRILSHDFEPTGLCLLPGGGAEQDPEDWWRAVVLAARSSLEAAEMPAGDIAAVSCTTQWSGTVPVNSNGTALGNALIWLDSRGRPYVQRISGGLLSVAGYSVTRLPRWIRLTGGIPSHSGKDSIAHILYLKHDKAAVYESAHKFLEPKDYLNLRLTGEFTATYDSIALHWVTNNRNPYQVTYDEKLLKWTGVDGNKLPDLHRAVEVVGGLRGEAAEDLGLRAGIPVVGGTPDMHSAAIGSGAVRHFQAHLYLGTSSWITCHIPFKKTDLLHNMASLPAALPGRYLVVCEQETAGASLEFVRDRVLGSEEAEGGFLRMEHLAGESDVGSGGVIFTPWLYGERTPVEDHTVRGGFHNLSLETTLQDMIRSAYEGVAYNSRWLLEHVEKFAGRRLEPLNAIGGGAQSGLWCRIHADVLQRKIRQVEEPRQANLRGAALLAGMALGDVDADEIPECVEIQTEFTPDPQVRDEYDHLYGEFLNIYRKTAKIYRRLNS